MAEKTVENDVVFEPSTLQNSSDITIKYNENQSVMGSNSQEENNNTIDTVIEKFKDMGNISKNLAQCSRNLGSSTKLNEDTAVENNGIEEEDPNNANYDSEEFDDYKEEEFSKKLEGILSSPANTVKTKQVTVQKQLPRSATSVQSSTRSKSRLSVGSTGSVVRRHPKINMSFSNDKSKQIERDNNILLKKILNAKSDKTTTPKPPLRLKSSNSSVSRKRLQEKIQHDNLIILKKIQRAKSSDLSSRR